jgi:hypothetical protein
MKIPKEKQQSVAVVCVLVILLSLGSIIIRQCGRRVSVNLHPYIGAGELLADETIKLLHNQGQIVLVAYDTKKAPMAFASVQQDAFTKRLKKQSRITIAAVESLSFNPPEAMMGPFVLNGEKYRALIGKHANVDAFVSLVGAPVMTDAEMRQLPEKMPRCVVFGGGGPGMQFKDLFRYDIIQVAVVGRFTPTDANAPKPRTDEEWCKRYFQVITAATAPSLPY